MRLLSCRRAATALLAAIAGLSSAWAERVELRSVADTTLIEAAPSNNLGGQIFFNSGATQMPRGINSYLRARGLFRFDFTGAIPPGSIVTRVELRLTVVGHPSFGSAAASTFGVHRMLRDWGEGDKNPGPVSSPGLGFVATTNEATWTHRFFPAHPWGAPGCQANIDYELFANTTAFVEFQDTYTFADSIDTVTNVQNWVDHPEQNFGYLLRSQSEGTPFTARRFGSREDPFAAPLLIVDFIPFKIESVQRNGSNLDLSFTAAAGRTYGVEARENAGSGTWTVLTNIPPAIVDTPMTLSFPATPAHQFFRLRQP